MLVCASLFRVFWLGRKEVWTGLIFILSGFMFLAWPPSIFIALSIFPAVVLSAGRWTKSKILFIAICAVLLMLISLPYVIGIMKHSDPAAYVGAETNKVELAQSFNFGFDKLKVHLRSANPLLLVLGFVGVWFFPRRGIRYFYGPIMLCLALLAGWGEIWKPQFQLERAGIPLLFVAIVPASLWMSRILEKGPSLMAPARAVIVALLIFSGLNISKVYGNKPKVGYCVLSEEVVELTQWIHHNTPENGRVLFAGKSIHGYSGGHVSYLPVMSGREMMGCDYFHFSPNRVDYNYPPRGHRESGEKIYAFAELYNVTHIITYHENWKQKLRDRPELFDEVYNFGAKTPKTIFRVERTPDIFLVGAGAVKSDVNKLAVTLEDPSDTVVLKYNWTNGLNVKPPVTIRPYKVDEDIRFIEIDPKGQDKVTIKYIEWF